MSDTLLTQFLENFEIFWTWLQNVSSDSQHPFRYPTVITSHNGIPNARTMVLRDTIHHQLFFFTDARSPKVMEMEKNPNLCVHNYDRKNRTQFILQGTCTRIQDHPQMNTWKDWALRNHKDYTSSLPPSHHIFEPFQINFSLLDFEHNFTVCSVNIHTVEMLQIQNPIHQRFRWTKSQDGIIWKKKQLVP
jgi:pyridoxamine 5'-phosphate oxidase